MIYLFLTTTVFLPRFTSCSGYSSAAFSVVFAPWGPGGEVLRKAPFFLTFPEGGAGLVINRQVPSTWRLQSPPGRTGRLARGSYNFRKRLPF